MRNSAEFLFFEELNDFLPSEKRKTGCLFYFYEPPSVEDAIEAQGIAHTEVDLIFANDHLAGLDCRLHSMAYLH